MHSVPSSTSLGPQPEAEDQLAVETFNVELFKKHVIQLFGRERGGHMARWVYMDLQRGGDLSTGSELWSSFVNAAQAEQNSYYLTAEEVQLIKKPQTLATLKDLFAEANRVVDLGSGSEFSVINKAMPIVHGLPNVEVYTPFDISQMMLDKATKAANDDLKGCKILPVHGDFSTGKVIDDNEPVHFDPEDGKNLLGLLLGSTITNQEMDTDDDFPREQVVEKLEKLGTILNNGEREHLTGKHGLIVGYDSNLDPDSAYAAYEDAEGGPKLWAPLITGVMFDIKRILDPQPFKSNNGGFDPQGWHHERVVETGPPLNADDPNSPPQFIVLHQCVVADKEQDFKIENGESRRFIVKENDRFVIKNNFKFHPHFFRQLAREAKFTPLDAIQIEGNNAILQPLEVSY